MPEDGIAVARTRIPKTVEFDADEYDELDEFRARTRKPSFSEAVRIAVRYGLQAIKQLEGEGKAVL